MIYEVTITETLSRTVQIAACSKEEAIAKAREAHKKEEIALDYSDFSEVKFKAVNTGNNQDEEDEYDGGVFI